MEEPLESTPPRTPSPPPRRPRGPLRLTDRREWDTPMRARINTLRYTKPCKTPTEISRITGVPRTTIITICERDDSLLRRPRLTRKPKYKLSREVVLAIEKDMDGHWSRGSMETQELIDLYGLGVVPATLISAFRREGVGHFWAAEDKFLTKKNMKERDDFCRILRDDLKWITPNYKCVLYSDAAHFAVNQRKKKKVWRRRGRDSRKNLYRNRLDKVHKKLKVQKVSTTIAAMVGWNYKSPLVIIPRHINGDDYIEYFLAPVVAPFFEKEREKAQKKGEACRWIFQEDNEAAHGTNSILNAPNDFKNTYHIRQLKPCHPPNSPDLSPIENIWRILKQRVKRRKARTQVQLRQYIFEEWDKITITEINKEILSMEARINQCIERKGDVTEF